MSQDARQRIFDAAFTVAARDGLLSMTLDNVAKEAGISKGGLTYHFPSKDVLIRQMLEAFGDRVVQQLSVRVAADPQPRMRWVRNLLACALADPIEGNQALEPIDAEMTERFMLTALAAAIYSPGLFEPLLRMGLELKQQVLAEQEGGMDQLLLWLAVDGLFLWRFIGMIRRDDPLFDQIVAALRRQVAPDPAEASASTACEEGAVR